ncbi:MAG: DUF2892 domain-containing protein [Gammaproteobacteria bacterium]|nr:DUF2892 domain-containing protein [Gammaproteobacteria bacterium]MDH5799944.1 DUF2892 domain-containing protein [Gammaproteobacteria bacterium]
MNTQTVIFDTKTNVGSMDQSIRFALGLGLIAVPLSNQSVDADVAALTALLAIPVMFTAISRWCPIYALLRIQSVGHKYQAVKFWGRNMGFIDAAFRYVLGSVLILVVMSLSSISYPWLALVGATLISSAILLWDPLYALFETGTQPSVTPKLVSQGGAEVIRLGDVQQIVAGLPRNGGDVKAA